ncbi:MAG TPA: asparagine synthase [bacterium]|nr:asparagine synthase [bacterium]
MVDKLEQKIKDSVESVVSKIERPFGIFLSGGIDSTLLAALTKPDVAITCRLPYGKKYDEFEDACATVKHLGLRHEVVTFTKKDFQENISDAVNMTKPTTHFSLVPMYMLFKKVQELGLETVLSGEGLDEYLGGYASYTFITNEQKFYEQPELENYKPLLDRYLGTPLERFARILGKKPEELKPYWDKYSNLLSKIGYADLHLRGIEDMELQLAKGFGVNLVYPYMTKELEEFCFKEIPDDEKIKGFTTKYILRKIAEKYIPKHVAWRKNKMGGAVAPIGLWFGQEDEFDKTKYLELQSSLWKSQQ